MTSFHIYFSFLGIRPYKCSYCSHASSLIHNCKAHIKQKHPGMEVKVVTLPIPDLVVEPEEHLEGAADEGSDGHEHEDDQGTSIMIRGEKHLNANIQIEEIRI